MSARATSEGGEARGDAREEWAEEQGWAPVPQVTRRCYNPQRRPLKAANVWRCQLQVVPQSLLPSASSVHLPPSSPLPPLFVCQEVSRAAANDKFCSRLSCL